VSVDFKLAGSLRRRLVIQLLGVAMILSFLLYLTVQAVAGRAAETTLDNILGASASSIADQLRSADEGIIIDIPYSAFSMLGSISEDRVFYRVVRGNLTLTGYEDLPLPSDGIPAGELAYYTVPYRDTTVRIAAVSRVIPIENESAEIAVLVAQTRLGQGVITARIANTAAALGVGFFLLAMILSLITAESAIRPLRQVAASVARRGPRDLQQLRQPTVTELAPLVQALNGFMGRLQKALTRTETFIAEAAHHVRTPLATVRTQAEIALRHAEAEGTRQTLRSVIRSVDESSRSAGQLLDHAMVTYRSDHLEHQRVDVAEVTRHVVRALGPTGEMKDLSIDLSVKEGETEIPGDRVLIESALRNLLDNAIKYSPPDSRIGVDVHPQSNGVRISITDEGRGLDGASKETLTERFSRGENVDDVVGSGLGLTIVDEVAGAHNGTFELDGIRGQGTCASLFLPRS